MCGARDPQLMGLEVRYGHMDTEIRGKGPAMVHR